MNHLSEVPYGFEDGHIVGYSVNSEKCVVEYEFWNARHGTFEFPQLLGCCDGGAVGVTVGGIVVDETSDFLSATRHRYFDRPPDSPKWWSFRCLDVEGAVMFEVVSTRMSFCEI